MSGNRMGVKAGRDVIALGGLVEGELKCGGQGPHRVCLLRCRQGSGRGGG